MPSHEMIQTLIIEDIIEKFVHIPDKLSQKIKSIDDIDILKKVYSSIIDCKDLKEIQNIIFNSRITTKSGVYHPIIIDFTQMVGNKRLEEIKQDINN